MCGLLWRTSYQKIKKIVEKKKIKAKKPSKSTYNSLLQEDYPLFQKFVPIGFVLSSILRPCKISKNRVTDERTDGGEIKGPFGFLLR